MFPQSTTAEDDAPSARRAEPLAVEYDSGPSGEVMVSEAALEALGRTRRPVLLSAAALFLRAGLGLTACGAALVGAILNARSGNGGDSFYLKIWCVWFGIFMLCPLIGGPCLLRLYGAMRRAYRVRRPEDWERVVLAQLLVWRLFPIALGVAMAVPFGVLVTAIIAEGNFP